MILLSACGGGAGDARRVQAPDPVARAQEQAAQSAQGRQRALAVSAQAAALARWEPLVNLPIVPGAGATLANGRVLLWSAQSRGNFGLNGGHTYTVTFDPATNAASERDVTETGHEMFCPGTSRLPDGRLLVAGGANANLTSLYDPMTNAWSRGPAMNIPRGYNANTVLSDGSVLTLGGSWNAGGGGKTAEVYTPQGGWRLLSGLPYTPYLLDGTYKSWQSDAHASLLPTGNGRVLMAGPSPEMAWIDTRGNGSSQSAGRRGDDQPAVVQTVVMYDAGKILKAGGATWNGNVPASAAAYLINTTGATAAVKKLAPMAYPRAYANSVVLPNGQVVIIGGQTYVQEFSDSNAVLAPEIWDPQTETFTVLPAMAVPRNYHSIAMLLPDGRVLSAGGGLCGCAADKPNLQIMSPPYLRNADGSAAARPVITAAPTTIGYGTTMKVSADASVTAFSLVRLGAVTHTVNNDQRRVSLTHTRNADGSYSVAVPSNAGILLPGQWMLFAMNAAGTPSVARIVTVNLDQAPRIENPGNVDLALGAAVDLPTVATTRTGTLRLSASGLPSGLNIDPASGRISGAPTVAGSYLVTLRADNGLQTVSTDLLMTVAVAGTGTGLLGQYHAGPGLAGLPLQQRLEAPDFAWGAAAPAPNVPADNFSVRWTGWIEATATGAAELRTVSDDGVRLWLDDRLVIDNWAAHGSTTDTASVAMVAGQRYRVTLEYYELGGDAVARLLWRPPGAAGFVPVPKSRLYPAAAPSTTNLALGRPASQISTLDTGAATRAVDGNTAGAWTGNSVTHTQSTANAWWQVDLGEQRRIDLIQIWNRTDCCSDRLQNFTVFVAATDMTGRSMADLLSDPAVLKRSVGASAVLATIGVPIAGLGRHVRVQLNGTGILSLAEVQVFGGPGAYGTPSIAAVADQNSTVGAGVSVAVRATDPDRNRLTYTATGLPPGLTIGADSGLIAGSPSTAGSQRVTVTASNAGGKSASAAFNWTVNPALPALTAPTLVVATSGSAVRYAPAVGAGGGAVQYSWNFGDGSADTPWAPSAESNHSYASPGVYSVTLTARTADGRSTTLRFVQAVVAPGPVAQARSSSNLLLEPRSGASARLWVVNPDNDSVSVFDTATRTRVAEIAVGAAPRTLARGNDGRVWVVNKQSATISVISPSSLTVVQTVALPRASQPFGIVVAPADGSVFVALEALGRVLRLDGSSGAERAAQPVGDNPRHLALSATGDRLLVSRFITAPLPGEGTASVNTAGGGAEVLELTPGNLALIRAIRLAHSDRADNEVQGRGIPNYLGAAVIAPDGRSAWVPSKQDNIARGPLRDGRPLDFQNTVRAITSRIDLGTGSEDARSRVDHDNSSVASAAAFHPSGAYLFVALETSRQVAVLDAAGKRELFRFEVGLAPQGLVVSADGLSLYVNNLMSRSVSVIDLAPLVRQGQFTAAAATWSSVTTERLSATVLKGKQLFYDARDPRLARDSYMSCASCHNDAGHDGRVWDLSAQGEGLRNTIALRGRAGTGQGRLHWSGNFDEVQDFEGQIRSLAGGSGLMSDAQFNTGTRKQPLGERKAGISADLDALAAYVSSLSTFDAAPGRNVDGSLTAPALAGRSVFRAQCASCHAGNAFSDSGTAGVLRDVGTIKPTSGKRLGAALTGIDTPTLRDAWATAPYLHDGSAPTVEAAVTAHRGLTLTANELANVATYVRQIGAEEVVEQGIAASPLFGSATQGSVFTDPVLAGQVLTGVTVRAGWWIDGLQGLATPANLPLRGGTGGGQYNATWPAGEYLVRLYGQAAPNGNVGQIAFVTNTGRVLGPYGSGQGQGTLTPFDFTVPAGQRVLGFAGRSAASLNAIGVLYGPAGAAVPAPTPSPVGSVLLAGAAGSLVDKSGATWTFGPNVRNVSDRDLLRNGVATGGFANKMQVAADGTVWAGTASGTWWSYNGTVWLQQAGAPAGP